MGKCGPLFDITDLDILFRLGKVRCDKKKQWKVR